MEAQENIMPLHEQQRSLAHLLLAQERHARLLLTWHWATLTASRGTLYLERAGRVTRLREPLVQQWWEWNTDKTDQWVMNEFKKCPFARLNPRESRVYLSADGQVQARGDAQNFVGKEHFWWRARWYSERPKHELCELV